MIRYEDLYNEVKSKLTEKRFKHSEGVVKRAMEYAEIYDADKEIVKLVAIAHDIAKELTPEENKSIIDKYGIVLDEIEQMNGNLLHAKIGAYICKNEYGFTDDMVNSVMYHSTGRENMSLLEKITYLADATDETRTYLDLDYYVNLVKNDIDMAMLEVSRWVLDNLLSKKHVIHPNSLRCYNYYVNK